MANGHGGARPGAGRKKKALSEKIIDGNPGKAPLTKLQFSVLDSDLHGEDERRDRCGDGGSDGSQRYATHHLRHVQGHR